MSRSKKSKKAANQENPAQVEGQEVNGEVVPPTIVDAGAEEVFPIQGKNQEAATGQTEEKTAPKPRISKRPYIADVETLLNAGTHTKQEMLALIQEKYPKVSRGGAATFLSDLMNEKYRHWKDRAVMRKQDGKMVFADRIEAPAPEAPPTGEPGEKPEE
jgi:hypothetical protein